MSQLKEALDQVDKHRALNDSDYLDEMLKLHPALFTFYQAGLIHAASELRDRVARLPLGAVRNTCLGVFPLAFESWGVEELCELEEPDPSEIFPMLDDDMEEEG